MAKLLRQKLTRSLGYCLISILVSAIIVLILSAVSFTGVGSFRLAKIPMYLYLTVSLVMVSFFFLLTSSKDYYQDLPVMVEASYHRKKIQKAMIVEVLFNIGLATGVIILAVFGAKLIGNVLEGYGIAVYYSNLYTDSPLFAYVLPGMMISSLSYLVISFFIYLAYRFNSILVFVVFVAGLIALTHFYLEGIKNATMVVVGDEIVSLVIALISIILAVLFTNPVKNLKIK
ncbi:MAG: hypothetical protein SPI59_00175 [Finegoldia sp.]|nr:hypothetical protein [Finegoldia sp.]